MNEMTKMATMSGTQMEEQRMTSLEIAELTGKQHFHVMEAIRKLEPAWKKVAASNFRLGSYKDLNGQLRPCYSLTKTECLYIATKFKQLERELREEVEIQRQSGPQNLLELLPDEFTREQFRQMRQQQGRSGDGESTLRSWQSRGHIAYDETTGRYCKTEEYKRKYCK